MDVAVHHLDDGIVVIQVHHDHRHGIQTCELTRLLPPMSGNELIAAIPPWPGDGRNQHAKLLDTLDQLHHARVVSDAKGVVRVGVKLIDLDLIDLTQCFYGLFRDRCMLLSCRYI